MQNQPEIIQSAIGIATKDLKWCYRERGIISGARLVYWSWDSFFAGMGATRLQDYSVVKRNFELYLDLQNYEGLIPKRIAHPLYWMRYIGIPLSHDPVKQRPTFLNSYLTAESIAQNPILIIAFWDYIRQSSDLEFAGKYLIRLKKIASYLQQHEDEKGLLKESMGGGWAESVLKRGAIAFTNMCYTESLRCLAEICQRLGDDKAEDKYRQKSEKVKAAIQKWLWSEEDGGYYSDWYGQHRHHHFATDGNLLAIWWGIASPEQARKIQDKISELSLEDDVPIRLAYDKYDFWRICIYMRLGGIKDYHVGFSWTWLGCVDAIVKVKLGQTEQAIQVLEKIATVIVRDKTVHEIYHKGKAVRTFFYKSEHPWAWGAGMFLLACSELGYKLGPE